MLSPGSRPATANTGSSVFSEIWAAGADARWAQRGDRRAPRRRRPPAPTRMVSAAPHGPTCTEGRGRAHRRREGVGRHDLMRSGVPGSPTPREQGADVPPTTEVDRRSRRPPESVQVPPEQPLPLVTVKAGAWAVAQVPTRPWMTVPGAVGTDVSAPPPSGGDRGGRGVDRRQDRLRAQRSRVGPDLRVPARRWPRTVAETPRARARRRGAARASRHASTPTAGRGGAPAGRSGRRPASAPTGSRVQLVRTPSPGSTVMTRATLAVAGDRPALWRVVGVAARRHGDPAVAPPCAEPAHAMGDHDPGLARSGERDDVADLHLGGGDAVDDEHVVGRDAPGASTR